MKRLHRVFSLLLSLISAAMLGLAAGALWMLPVAFLRLPPAWFAVPVGALLGLAIARWVSPRSRLAPPLAAAATLLAAVYVGMLIAAVRVAGALGLELSETIRTAGPDMLWSLASHATGIGQWAGFLLGAVTAAAVARRFSRRAP